MGLTKKLNTLGVIVSFRKKLTKVIEFSRNILPNPMLSLRLMGQLSYVLRSQIYSQHWESSAAEYSPVDISGNEAAVTAANPLKIFFDSRKRGRGIWKWDHYFDIYHRHFSRFVGHEVNVLEIGVYSGGSLEMWKDYFGPKCRVYGVDMEEACKFYENEYTRIFVGDQEDRNFWKDFKKQVPAIDILIDDGGHRPVQQIATLEEMLPYLRPGGVYLCEDIHGECNDFSAYLLGLVNNLNTKRYGGSESSFSPTEFQAWIRSIQFYPYVTVIEKAENPIQQLIASKHGTDWQPFL